MSYRVGVSEQKYCNTKSDTVLQVCCEEESASTPFSPAPFYSPEMDGCGGGYYSPRSFGSFMRASRSRRFYDLGLDAARTHFLQACNLCKRPLGEGDDIFMYRGDTPFCSEECRQKQIDADETKEKMWSSVKAMQLKRKTKKPSPSSDQQESSGSPSRADDLRFRAGTVAAG